MDLFRPRIDPMRSTDVIAPGNSLEMARLMNQQRYLTASEGGLFPERTSLAGIQRILDLACGPGGWVLDVAQALPRIQVLGVDLSPEVIEYARAQAWAQGLDNAHFQVMDVLEPLALPDHAFDLVNARSISRFMPRAAWPALMREGARVLRPGGILRLTESENTLTSSPACERVSLLYSQALSLAGQSVSPDGLHLGITALLTRFLRQAGCQQIQVHPSVLDVSFGEPWHSDYLHNHQVFLQAVTPFLLAQGVTTEQELDLLLTQVAIEMNQQDFCGLIFTLLAWGTTPCDPASPAVQQHAQTEQRAFLLAEGAQDSRTFPLVPDTVHSLLTWPTQYERERALA